LDHTYARTHAHAHQRVCAYSPAHARTRGTSSGPHRRFCRTHGRTRTHVHRRMKRTLTLSHTGTSTGCTADAAGPRSPQTHTHTHAHTRVSHSRSTAHRGDHRRCDVADSSTVRGCRWSSPIVLCYQPATTALRQQLSRCLRQSRPVSCRSGQLHGGTAGAGGAARAHTRFQDVPHSQISTTVAD
jgi:hypothetical protein